MGPMGVNEGPGPRMGPILADEVSGGRLGVNEEAEAQMGPTMPKSEIDLEVGGTSSLEMAKGGDTKAEGAASARLVFGRPAAV